MTVDVETDVVEYVVVMVVEICVDVMVTGGGKTPL